MKYQSTRGNAPELNFSDVLLAGLASDGGLYVPYHWPQFTHDHIRNFRSLSYHELAFEVMHPFVAGSISDNDLRELTARAYSRFTHQAIAPLKQMGHGLWFMELFHGPTFAFKDFAMQLLGELFAFELNRRNESVTIIGATSGDTGSAAIEAFQGKPNVTIFILHPHGRVSPVQRKQMTTVAADNVHNIALEGNFDDCQTLVKAMFTDQTFRRQHNLSAINSINWARVAAQTVYYFYAAAAVGAPDVKLSFAVPTGNFGNIYAGYIARKMGLPIERLIIGSNRNDILTRFCQTGEMRTEDVVPTLSPSMDIQISSNFERLLLELYEHDPGLLTPKMEMLKNDGGFTVEKERHNAFLQLFDAHRYDDDATRQWMQKLYQSTQEIIDPHSAIGLAAAIDSANNHPGGAATVCLGTAHPAKFSDAVNGALGIDAKQPEALAALEHKAERFEVLPNELSAVTGYINALS
ncbi:MAG: threonine synthase [Arenicellales bacterium WSBS_2016_MAG_OTU3]